MDKYIYWLDCIEGLGTEAKRNLLEAFGSGKAVFDASEKLLKYILETKKRELFLEARKKERIETAYEELLANNIRFCSCFDKEFPEKLRVIPDMPFMIYYTGKLPEIHIPTIMTTAMKKISGSDIWQGEKWI